MARICNKSASSSGENARFRLFLFAATDHLYEDLTQGIHHYTAVHRFAHIHAYRILTKTTRATTSRDIRPRKIFEKIELTATFSTAEDCSVYHTNMHVG